MSPSFNEEFGFEVKCLDPKNIKAHEATVELECSPHYIRRGLMSQSMLDVCSQ